LEITHESPYRAVLKTVRSLELVFATAILAVVVLILRDIRSMILLPLESNLAVAIPLAAVGVSCIVAVALSYRTKQIIKRLELKAHEQVNVVSGACQETESETLLRALEVFGSSDRATEWMRVENPALGNQPPIRVIQTEAGRKAVRDVLGRIEHGVIS
jgi:uncharacterized protein (DUF2384 family)